MKKVSQYKYIFKHTYKRLKASFLTSLTSTDEALSDPRPPSSSRPRPFNEPTPWESFSRCAEGLEWVWLWVWLWAWLWPEWGLQLAKLFSLRFSGGLVGISKSVLFLNSSPTPSLGEGLEYSSRFFHTPSFTCLRKPINIRQNHAETSRKWIKLETVWMCGSVKSTVGGGWVFVYLLSVLRVSVMDRQRFRRASSLCGSSFRNFTASTSTLKTTRILLCSPGNWSEWDTSGEVTASQWGLRFKCVCMWKWSSLCLTLQLCESLSKSPQQWGLLFQLLHCHVPVIDRHLLLDFFHWLF